VILLALFAVLVVGQEPRGGESARPAIEKKTAQAGPITVHFLTIPWGPNTFEAMERGGDSFYAKRTWPFARMETTRPVVVEGTRVPAGNYALVFHPNPPDNGGMSLEVRRIVVAEFLEPGNVMTRTPEGETVARFGIQFETGAETLPALSVELSPTPAGVRLVIRYGDRRLVRELAF
jgi:hypothetical protein